MEINAPVYFIDFETLSDKNLKELGSYQYVYSGAFKVVCAAIAKNKNPPVPFNVENPPQLEDNAILVAHNVSFEQVVCRKEIPQWYDKKWIDTAALGAYGGYPPSLKQAAKYIGLNLSKLDEGEKVLSKTLKRNIEPNEEQLEILIRYNLIDVKICQRIFYKLIGQFLEKEQKIYEITSKSNNRGIRIDETMCHKAQTYFEKAHKLISKRVPELTDGKLYSINQVEKLKEWFGYENITKKTLEDKLKIETSPQKIEMITHRLLGGQKSANKFKRALDMSLKGRLRNSIVYYGTITGRYSSKGVQIQNLIKADKQDAIKQIKKLESNEELSLSDIVKLVRSMFIPNKGHVMAKADYSQIEARILAWLAGEKELLKSFKEGRPVYKEMASFIFKKKVSDITDHERFLGKSAVLGCGYGMGFKRFKNTYGTTLEEATFAVSSYQEKFKGVTRLWATIGRGIKDVIRMKEDKVRISKIVIFLKNDCLKLQLPSGRCISYLKPRMVGKDITFLRPPSMSRVSTYWGGTFTENICQGIARDLLCEAIIRLDKEEGLRFLFNVHDELVYSMDENKNSLDRFKKLVEEVPDWATGLPISSTADLADRYYKD